MIWQGYLKKVLDRHKEESAVVEITLKSADGNLLSRRLFYLAPPRKLSLPKTRISMKVEQVNEGYRISLESDNLAKNVMLGTEADGAFSDNYFDVGAGRTRTVTTPLPVGWNIAQAQDALQVRSLRDSYV